jgi:hypothetical protein
MAVRTAKRQGKGKKGRKIGRNLAKCQRYKVEGRRERNKARKIAKQKRKEEKSQTLSQKK